MTNYKWKRLTHYGVQEHTYNAQHLIAHVQPMSITSNAIARDFPLTNVQSRGGSQQTWANTMCYRHDELYFSMDISNRDKEAKQNSV